MNERRGKKRPQEIFSGVWIDELKDTQAPLVAKELLDALLERLLARFLVDDREQLDAFLKESSFVSRVRLTYLLGLISPEEAADLGIIERIRHEFARTLGERSFEDEDIRALVEDLETSRQFREHPASLGFARDARMRFNAAVHILARYLSFRAQDKAQDKSSLRRRAVHPPFRYAPPGEIPPVRGEGG
jgi:hypothetical protein